MNREHTKTYSRASLTQLNTKALKAPQGFGKLDYTPRSTADPSTTYYYDDDGNEFYVDASGRHHYTSQEG